MPLHPKIVERGRNASARYTVRYEVDGKQKERSFRLKREAEDFRLKVEYDQRSGLFIDPDVRTSVTDYFTAWLATHAVSAGTKRTYRSVFTNRIAPVLGGKAIGKVTRDDIRALLLEDMPGKVGPDMIKTARTLLTAMFGEALKSGKVAANPAAGIRLPNGRSERAQFYMATREELEALAGKLGPEWGLSVWLMRGCGLRPGEALGLRYEDFRGDVLRVERQRLQDGSTGPCKARDDGQYRDVPLPAYVASKVPGGEGELFPPGRTDVYRDRFTRAARDTGLPDGFHPHMLRHAYASALLAAGVPIFEVSRYLGHRSTDFTSAVYGHLIPSAASRAREALDAEMS